MKTIGCWLLVLQGFWAAASWSAEPIGRIEQLNGSAAAQGADGAARDLAIGSEIFLNDRVTTGEDAKLRIRFLDDTIVSQGARAEMIINEYVYAPAKKSENSAFFQLVSGVFRVITDQITKLNPDRFEVKTNYGTIGIRGCDLGFRLDADHEEIYVVSLDTADRVVITSHMPGHRGVHEIRADSTFITLSPRLGYEERPFTAGDRHLLEVDTTAGLVPAAAFQTVESDRHEKHESAESQTQLPNPIASMRPPAVEDPAHDLIPLPPEEREPKSEFAPELEAVPATPVKRPVETVEDGPATPEFPQVGPRKTQASGSGADWSWGVWSREVVDLVNDVPTTSYRTGADTGGNGLSSSDFQALAAGGVLYNLSGSGSAGALVSQGTQLAVLQGSVDISVTLGMGILPTWQGDFNLGSALQFSVPGSIQSDGGLQGSPSSYSLNAFGQSYGSGSLTRQDVNGKLVGPGTGVKPISGAVVDFHFEHGAGGPTVDGAGGTDLQ